MKAIKHTLTERWYAFENARNAAMEDPSVNLYADLHSGQTGLVYEDNRARKVRHRNNKLLGMGCLTHCAGKSTPGRS